MYPFVMILYLEVRSVLLNLIDSGFGHTVFSIPGVNYEVTENKAF